MWEWKKFWTNFIDEMSLLYLHLYVFRIIWGSCNLPKLVPVYKMSPFRCFFLSKNYSLPFNINNYKLELMGSSKWEVLFKRSDLQMLARSWKISMEEHFCKKCCRLATINGIKNEPFYNYFAHNVSEFWKHTKKKK